MDNGRHHPGLYQFNLVSTEHNERQIRQNGPERHNYPQK
jgi:hypothetical protein